MRMVELFQGVVRDRGIKKGGGQEPDRFTKRTPALGRRKGVLIAGALVSGSMIFKRLANFVPSPHRVAGCEWEGAKICRPGDAVRFIVSMSPDGGCVNPKIC